MKLYFLVFFALFSIQFGLAQENLPQDYFESPLEIPLILSGTFGELRSNHFHSGMDIKTHQQTGLSVVASASGYVSRIKISHFGYGKALYIQHPNGYTSVYAHLKEFAPEIEKYIKERQYAKESYEIEVFPQANELSVDQGELIAYSGNSGGSGGPHLHFEIRDSQARPMNPMQFGIDIKDAHYPIVRGMYVYPISENAHIDTKAERKKLRVIPMGNGEYKTEHLQAYGKIGFGINSVDLLNYAANKNGVNTIETFLNGKKLLTVDFNKFSFAESRYINDYIDYELEESQNETVQKLFITNNNPLSIFKYQEDQGYVEVNDSLDYNYKIEIKDYEGNTSVVRIPITPKEIPSENIEKPETKKTNYFVKSSQATAFDEDGFDVYIPRGALYKDEYLDISTDGESINVHHPTTALHQNITIGFDVSRFNDEDKEQLFIARMSDWGRPYYSTTYKKKNRFTTRTKNFGTYKLAVDNTPPLVQPVNFRNKKWMSNYRYLKFKISDDLSGISSYRGTINGKFILMEYDYKTNSLVYDFNDEVNTTETENNLKIIVVDNVGNSTTFEGTFFRKN
ncbi:M23 family metallopeptidase [Mesonia mobilis]|uniref:Peptidase M23 n=1 Tax=Mesonia mobilis TaxID=369791 RepID=A0ABQ3BVT6_9FLAO|nr:M23 family metallopeptidase [Mesonia mobilis]MBQ0736829.1 M23 family metallopeptidase [Aquimarina celericrescens]GGZ58926.1 peptidase M23 [Mesonia mobilis]